MNQKDTIKLNETAEAIFKEIELLKETSKTDKLSKAQISGLVYLQKRFREILENDK